MEHADLKPDEAISSNPASSTELPEFLLKEKVLHGDG
jgi:hypothetical protein